QDEVCGGVAVQIVGVGIAADDVAGGRGDDAVEGRDAADARIIVDLVDEGGEVAAGEAAHIYGRSGELVDVGGCAQRQGIDRRDVGFDRDIHPAFNEYVLAAARRNGPDHANQPRPGTPNDERVG